MNGVLIRAQIENTKLGAISYVEQATIDRIKAEGFEAVHPLAALVLKRDPETGDMRATLDAVDLVILCLRSS